MEVDVNPLQRACAAILGYQGYGLAELSVSVIDAVDSVNIGLRYGPPRPDVVISAQSVHYFSIHRMPGDDIPFFDINAVILEPGQPWPPQLPPSITASPSFPPLLWVHGDGPATFDLVAAIVTVLAEVGA